MSLHQRWDVALKVLNGPLVTAGEQVIRGPVVRIGADPGPGGLKLGGYRGLDARQCVITAYDAGNASVAPVGTNQIRLAPHSNVNWSDIDPIVGPEYLTPGCALHLGPVGRGATIEFVACRRLGEWKTGVLASERVDSPAPRGAVPEAYDVRRVGRISASAAPFWFLGCSFLMATTTAGIVGVLGIGALIVRPIHTIGPGDAEGYEFYESVQISDKGIDPMLLEGLHQPYYTFVMEPNIKAAGAEGRGWEAPESWDQSFVTFMTASVDAHARSWAFFSRLEAVRSEYSKVVLAMRRAGLPEVFAAIPYQESRYNASMPSQVCAEGYWQFMPETAFRIGSKEGLTFRVADCRFRGGSVTWSPTDLAPPPNVLKNGAYMDQEQCMIERCNVDDRKDLERSTLAAAFSLKEAWTDPVIAKSGAAVQLTITSHNSGYDDGRFGEKYVKRINVKPAYQAFVGKNGAEQGMFFVGANIRCPTSQMRDYCGASYLAETQHYAYTIVAQHILAVCYYARNYGEDPAFNPWVKFVLPEGYCKKFEVPTKETVRTRRASGGKK